MPFIYFCFILVSLSPALAENSAKANVASIFNLSAHNRLNIALNRLNIAHNHLNIALNHLNILTLTKTACILKLGRPDWVK